MMPDKPGYWWYQKLPPDWADSRFKSGPFIAEVVKYTANSLTAVMNDGISPVECSEEVLNITWLGPVNPEPMKVSGE